MRTPAHRPPRLSIAMLSSVVLLTDLLIANPADAHEAGSSPGGRAPFTATLSNLSPLAFGMDVGETSRALAQPLPSMNYAWRSKLFLLLTSGARSRRMT